MMKKILSILILVLLMVSETVPVAANSAPYVWVNYPSSSMMTIDENSPVEVTRESLLFDFTGGEAGLYEKEAVVSAAYEMKNTGEESITSQMVFPFIGGKAEESGVRVLVNGEEVPSELYYGPEAQENGEDPPGYLMDVSAIISSVKKDRYAPENFSYEDTGTRFVITAEPEGSEEMKMEVSFHVAPDEAALSRGTSSYSFHDDGSYSVGKTVRKGDAAIEIFVSGRSPVIEVRGYTASGDEGKMIPHFPYQVEKEEMKLADYFREFLKKSEYFRSALTTLQEEDLYFSMLDKALAAERHITEDHLSMYLQIPRYDMIVYAVPFAPGEEKTVEVSYKAYGTMDRRKTKDPTFTFHYFFHPAAHWKAFKDLTVTIAPPADYPYVLKSSMDFMREENGTYLAGTDTLPEDDLTFTLYTREEITALDKVQGTLSRNQYAVFFIGTLLLSMVILGVLTMIIKRVVLEGIGRKKRNDKRS